MRCRSDAAGRLRTAPPVGAAELGAGVAMLAGVGVGVEVGVGVAVGVGVEVEADVLVVLVVVVMGTEAVVDGGAMLVVTWLDEGWGSIACLSLFTWICSRIPNMAAQLPL